MLYKKQHVFRGFRFLILRRRRRYNLFLGPRHFLQAAISSEPDNSVSSFSPSSLHFFWRYNPSQHILQFMMFLVQLCIALRITGFINYVHHSAF
jgi:hypothetical protein